MKIFQVVVLLSVAALPAHAGSTKAGTAAGNFLRLGVDARAVAMGQAYGALSEDASAVYWNPAGLARLRQRHATVTHTFYLQSVFYDFIAFAHPLELISWLRPKESVPTGHYGTVGFGLLYLNAGRLDEVDNVGSPTGRNFTVQDIAASVSWGRSFGPLDIGITGKFVHSSLQSTAKTVTGDIGLKFHPPAGGARVIFAVSGHNLFGGLKFIQERFALPRQLRFGAALMPLKGLALTAEGVLSDDDQARYGVGAEFRIPILEEWSEAWKGWGDWGVVLRAGNNSLGSGNELEDLAGLTLGGGLWHEGLSVDYAWLPFGLLGNTHRFTIGYRF